MQPNRTIAIQPVISGHVPALHNLLQVSGLPLDGLDAHLPTVLVAREEEEIIGSAALEIYEGAALLRSVAVMESRRGIGLGHRLVEAAIRLAEQQQVDRLYLLTETAADWFPRFGFVPVERTAVDPSVQRSVEFASACPVSAQAMVLELPKSER